MLFTLESVESPSSLPLNSPIICSSVLFNHFSIFCLQIFIISSSTVFAGIELKLMFKNIQFIQSEHILSGSSVFLMWSCHNMPCLFPHLTQSNKGIFLTSFPYTIFLLIIFLVIIIRIVMINSNQFIPLSGYILQKSFFANFSILSLAS